MVNPKKCMFCEYYHKRSKEEIFNCKSPEEEQSFNGYCHRYPKKEEIKRDYSCGEWINKKHGCRFKNDDGTCGNNYFMKGYLCETLICDLDVL